MQIIELKCHVGVGPVVSGEAQDGETPWGDINIVVRIAHRARFAEL